MAGRRRSKRNRGSSNAKARRRRRVAGLGSGAGAVLAFGMGPLGSAPPAHADILDVIVDPIITPLQQAVTGVTDAVSAIDPSVGVDALAGLDPSVAVAGVDMGSVGLDPGSLAVSAADAAGSATSADALAAAVSSSDPLAGAASPTDLLANAASSSDPLAATAAAHGEWFNDTVYVPLHTDMEDWINSQFGTRVDDFINTVSGHDLIGNGVNGTAADPDGGNAGLLFGDGGNGYGPTGDGGNAGWVMGNGGNAGEATDGGAGTTSVDPSTTAADPSGATSSDSSGAAAAERPINGATGAHGGNAGRIMGDGGNGSNGGAGEFGGHGGTGGAGGEGGRLGGEGGTGGQGGEGGAGTATHTAGGAGGHGGAGGKGGPDSDGGQGGQGGTGGAGYSPADGAKGGIGGAGGAGGAGGGGGAHGGDGATGGTGGTGGAGGTDNTGGAGGGGGEAGKAGSSGGTAGTGSSGGTAGTGGTGGTGGEGGAGSAADPTGGAGGAGGVGGEGQRDGAGGLGGQGGQGGAGYSPGTAGAGQLGATGGNGGLGGAGGAGGKGGTDGIGGGGGGGGIGGQGGSGGGGGNGLNATTAGATGGEGGNGGGGGLGGNGGVGGNAGTASHGTAGASGDGGNGGVGGSAGTPGDGGTGAAGTAATPTGGVGGTGGDPGTVGAGGNGGAAGTGGVGGTTGTHGATGATVTSGGNGGTGGAGYSTTALGEQGGNGGAGGNGGPVGHGGNGGAGGGGYPGGLGGAAGTGALGSGTAGSAGTSSIAEVPLTQGGNGNLYVNISVAGGPNTNAIVDTGSDGLVISSANVNMADLGTPTAGGAGQTPLPPLKFGNDNIYELDTVEQFSAPVNFENGPSTAPETIDVVTATTQYIKGVANPDYTLANVDTVLGIGPDTGGPLDGTGMSVTSGLTGTLSDGELINLPAGELEFGTNPLPALDTVNGDGIAQPGLLVQISVPQFPDGQQVAAPGAFIDSGGLTGLFLPNEAPGLVSGQPVPVGTSITVDDSSGQFLYTETVTSANDPVVGTAPSAGSPGDTFNTGVYPFEYEPIYISNSPTGVGETIFDQPDTGVDTIPVGTFPVQVAVSPIGPEAGDIYVTNEESSTVSVISPATNTVVATVSLPADSFPSFLAVDPTGPEAGDVYVTGIGDLNNPQNDGTVWVISPTTNTVIDTIDASPNPDGLGVAVSDTGPTAGDVYVLTDPAANTAGTVEVIDPATNAVINTIALPGLVPSALAVSNAGPEAGDLYVSSAVATTGGVDDTVTVINPTTDSMDTITLPEFDNPGAIAVSDTGPTAGQVYVDIFNVNTGETQPAEVGVINPADNTITDIIPLDSAVAQACSGPCDVAVSPTGTYAGDVFVTGQVTGGEGTVFVINPTSDTVIDTFPVAPGPDTSVADGLAVSPIGPEAGDIYTANSLVVNGDSLEPSTVSVINPTTEGVPQ